MKALNTIKKNHEFRRVYGGGKSSVTPSLVVYCRKNRLGCSRLGITVSTKVGHAVVRNRAKRRLRELYRLQAQDIASGFDVILVARARTPHVPYRRLKGDFFKAMRDLRLLPPEREAEA